MNPNERCVYEKLAQSFAGDISVKHPVTCPVRQECLASGQNICLRARSGENINEVADNLVKSAMESETLVAELLETKSKRNFLGASK